MFPTKPNGVKNHAKRWWNISSLTGLPAGRPAVQHMQPYSQGKPSIPSLKIFQIGDGGGLKSSNSRFSTVKSIFPD